MKLWISIFIIIILPAALLSYQTHQELLDRNTRELLHEGLSGELTKEHVIAITRHHRIQGSRGYRNAAQYVLGKLREYGFSEKDAYIESFPSDGKVQYQTWQSPSGWDISSAELRMVEPDTERIVGYPEIAMSVITYSNPGDVTAELVWVGEGTHAEDYAGKDVKGKFVLATGYGGEVHRLAVLKYGAKAIVCYLDDERAKYYPNMLQYSGMWPRTDELSRVTFGFNLTNLQGTKLKEMILAGKKIVLHGWVKGIGLEPYFMDVVVAHIRGGEQSAQELVYSAHLDHPKESANDNASGSGAILDIARTYKDLIDTKRLPLPKKSFRFLWVPEWNGTMAYVDKHPEMAGPELGGKFLANMNMDMVGENQELVHSHLIVTRTPHSLPSCVNDVVANMTEMIDKMDIRTPRGSLSEFNYRITPYSGGSDHMMFIDRKIPGIMFSHSDYTHHTSEDTPDKVDPVELERCEVIAASTMWYLANLSPAQAADLAYLVNAQSSSRLDEASRASFQYLTAGGAAPNARRDAHTIVEHALWQELECVSSILDFNDAKETATLLEGIESKLRGQYEAISKIGSPAPEEEAQAPKVDNRIPIRSTRGPLDFSLPESKLDSSHAAWYKSKEFTLDGDMRFELVNFIDGKRTVSEIRDALSAEFTPVSHDVVGRYINDLVIAGGLKWK